MLCGQADKQVQSTLILTSRGIDSAIISFRSQTLIYCQLPNWIIYFFLLSNNVLDIIELFANLLLVLLFFPEAWNIVRNLKSQKLV